jgi:hypothetical protein
MMKTINNFLLVGDIVEFIGKRRIMKIIPEEFLISIHLYVDGFR